MQRPITHFTRAASLFMASVALAGYEAPTRSSTTDAATEASLSSAQGNGRFTDVPGVPMDGPPVPRAWDNDDAALIDAVAAGDGRVLVAFKEPASPKALAAGFRNAVSARTIEAGLVVVEALGAEIISEFPAIGAVTVRLDDRRRRPSLCLIR